MAVKSKHSVDRTRSAKHHAVRRTFLTGFILTLIFCSFLLFSSLALYNTAIDLYGRDVSLMQMERVTREKPLISIQILDAEYLVELSGVNQAVGVLQEHYPGLPRGLRGFGYLLEELKAGVAHLMEQQQIQRENKQLV